MAAIHFDSKLSDAERRAKIFDGDIFVCSARPATLALIDFARELLEEAFAPLPPRTAQFELSVEKFVEIFGPVKPRFIHHPKTAALMRSGVEPSSLVERSVTSRRVCHRRSAAEPSQRVCEVRIKECPRRTNTVRCVFKRSLRRAHYKR